MSRHRHDPLAPSPHPHWLTIADLHHRLISVEPLPAGVDLHQAMREAIAAWTATGWCAESEGAWGFCFATRGAERHLLSITSVDPLAPSDAGHAFLAGRGIPHPPG